MSELILKAISFYQKRISPLMPPMCRYTPTCSHYAAQAVSIHGAFRGSLLAIRRLLRCNVFFPGGYDPVPPKRQKK